MKIPDKKAPRFRRKIKTLINPKFFKDFKELHPEYKDLTYLKFKEIIIKYNGLIRKTSVNYRYGVRLPYNLGFLLVISCENKKENRAPNWNLIGKKEGVVRHSNWDSDGLLAKIMYSNYSLKYNFLDRILWRFQPSREFKKDVSRNFAENYENYIKANFKTKISKLFQK